MKDQVLKIFESIRDTPHAPFEEENFMQYLVKNPSGRLKNTFKGARKYFDFMEKLEQAFSICWSVDDLDKLWSLNQLLERIQEKQTNITDTKKLVTKRIYEIKRDMTGRQVLLSLLIAALCLVILFPAFKSLGFHFKTPLIALTPLLFWIGIVIWIYLISLKQLNHYKQLKLKLEKKQKMNKELC